MTLISSFLELLAINSNDWHSSLQILSSDDEDFLLQVSVSLMVQEYEQDWP